MEIAGYHNKTKADGVVETTFEELYLEVRGLEKRALSDGQVMFLPDVDASNIYYKEWQVRKRSSKRLIAYLTEKKKPLKILEIGCGNGWLSSKLATIPHSTVIGLDINQPELNQARRVFKKHNLEFICENFSGQMFADKRFDVILFAASISYFPSAQSILREALHCLATDGEIHLMDSHFYKPREVENAKIRCQDYYATLGCPGMAAYYFHHTLSSLQPFNYKILANPHSLVNRIGKKEPFYWIAIHQQ